MNTRTNDVESGFESLRQGASATSSAPRRTALGQYLLETHDPVLGRLHRRMLVLIDGRRDSHVLSLILDEVPMVEELGKLVALGWIEWEAAPGLRRAA